MHIPLLRIDLAEARANDAWEKITGFRPSRVMGDTVILKGAWFRKLQELGVTWFISPRTTW